MYVKLVPPVSVLCSFRSLLPLPMYLFICPLSLKYMLLRLVRLKEYGLGTHSVGIDWPLSEVETGLEQQTCSSPHRLIIWACLTTWRQITNNNNMRIYDLLNCVPTLLFFNKMKSKAFHVTQNENSKIAKNVCLY